MKAAAATTWKWVKRCILAVLAIVVAYQAWLFAWVLWWGWINPSQTNFMAIRLAELRQKNPKAELKHHWVPYAKISNHLKRALIASEDARFVDHEGFDWDGIQKAIAKNQKKRRFVAGGSTISQQLAKNLFLSPTKSYFRKAEEAVITLMIEATWDKQRILEVYMNVIEWGNGVFGAEAAARHYFNTAADRLAPEQAARLAGMVPNPRFYDRHRGAPGLGRKTAIILARMSEAELP